jgi:hypothetical protein
MDITTVRAGCWPVHVLRALGLCYTRVRHEWLPGGAGTRAWSRVSALRKEEGV